jgi:Uma2 family endonuclease
MAEPAKRRATYADLEAVPPHLVAEIIHGALVTHPRPSPRHGFAANALSASLTRSHQWGDGGPGGWIFIVEPELHLGNDIVVPDIAGWRRDRLPVLPETAYFETPPDWVCEVLSNTTERYDRNSKRTIYARAQLPHLWLLDPRSNLLEVFQLAAGQWLLIATFSGNDDVRAPPFDASAFPLGLLWPSTPPTS